MNIIIYSDGTGQRGGITFDERRSNIYKLFRATRCSPDSDVDPAEQLAFYDPGLGTVPAGHDLGLIATLVRMFYNLVSRATGLGLTRNIIDCYAALIRLWRPGDRIFLFGFSRGAYTVRCVSGVLALCGVPTCEPDGEPLRRDLASCRRIAGVVVKRIYQHTESRKRLGASARQVELLDQRLELARRFRLSFGSADATGVGDVNVYPYFIGVFDTVASLANPSAIVALSVVSLAALGILSAILALFSAHCWFSFGRIFGGLIGASVVCPIIVHTWSRIRWEIGLRRKSKWHLFHLTAPRMKFYDTDLSPNVSFARHALSIDERRTSFQRVPWGSPRIAKKTQPEWFEQLWFAGDHSDAGGGYPENEARLSDISLSWMVEAANAVGLKYDASVLKLHPDPLGPQHDQTKSSLFRYFGKRWREIEPQAPLHPSVIERFKAQAVLDYNLLQPYRPANLSSHKLLENYYLPS